LCVSFRQGGEIEGALDNHFIKHIMKYFFLFLFIATIFSGKLAAQITQKQINVFLNDTAVRSGHVGISIYEPTTQKYLYNYNAEKNFTPSSNVKLFTLYAGMKYLGDSLVGLRYQKFQDSTKIFATGDPTFLHPIFKNQPVFNFLKVQKKITFYSQFFNKNLGDGWAWNDYLDDYMVERSEFPIFGNMLTLFVKDNEFKTVPKYLGISGGYQTNKKLEKEKLDKKMNEIEWDFRRDWGSNDVEILVKSLNVKNQTYQIPMSTINRNNDFYYFLSDTLNCSLIQITNKTKDSIIFNNKNFSIIHSQPTDSLFRPMMHNSDNFFAEQTLLMVSNEKLGYMSDENIIDTLLKTDFKDLPTKPRWVDGCGLSRYNLFSPKDFIFLLDKMKNEFGMERLKGILTTGGQGTLKGYYENAVGSIYAKTGSMSNNVSLSGYLFTKKNKMLIFSVQINSFSGSGRAGRRAIEKMLQQIRENN
jgi:serine-type D-Ala-D-Ala carboxypeptidase/endopeptidase (penicillin-binding protein 4)